jgi:hypothetical protein
LFEWKIQRILKMMIKNVCILNALLTADWKTRIFSTGADLARETLSAEMYSCSPRSSGEERHVQRRRILRTAGLTQSVVERL